MKLGCQSAPTNETHLQYLARYGVRNICGYPEIGEGRLYATVDELKRMRDLAEKTAFPLTASRRRFWPPRMSTRHRTTPSCWRDSPERDRDIEALQNPHSQLRRRGDSLHQVQHEPSGRAAHGAHSGTGRRDVQHVAAEGGASRSAAHPRRARGRRHVLGADHLFSGARDSRRRGVQDPHGVPPARSGRAAGRLPGSGPRAGHRGRVEAIHHHQGKSLSRAELLPGHGFGNA